MMQAVLGVITLGLTAQATFGKLLVEFAGVQPVKQDNGLGGGFTNALQEVTAASVVQHTESVPRGARDLQSSGSCVDTVDPQFLDFDLVFYVSGFAVTITASIFVNVRIMISKEGVSGPPDLDVVTSFIVDPEGGGVGAICVDGGFLDGGEFLCETCSVTLEAGECTAEECGGYDQEASNLVATEIRGDPHMVGLLGQKIDWAGVDNAWYCLFNDGPDFHVNVRLSAPMPEEVPDRQLISAVSILSDDGRSSLVVEVQDPYTTNTEGCPGVSSLPCLADGGLRIMVDGEESTTLQASAVSIRLPGSYPVVVSAVNLPAECRPFGGDRIWASQFEEMVTKHRSLRLHSVSFGEWILKPDTLAAPTWCAKFLEEGGDAGILSASSKHATIRVETPKVSVRINVGVNHQDLETAPDGKVLVPELEFWRTDLGFDGLQLSDSVTGLMGDNARFVFDNEGVPVTSGLGALHGAVESYRVARPLARDFDKLHG